MNILSVCGFLLCALCINLFLHRLRPEFAPLTIAASGLLLAVYFLQEIASSLTALSSYAQSLGLSAHLELLLKALAIALACQMTSALCRDCGESALAEKAELAGKVAIFSLSVPLITQLLSVL